METRCMYVGEGENTRHISLILILYKHNPSIYNITLSSVDRCISMEGKYLLAGEAPPTRRIVRFTYEVSQFQLIR